MFGSASLHPYGTLGLHWVGDLAFESEVEVQSEQGELLLQLVKGGIDFDCRIDIASGQAVLSMGGGRRRVYGRRRKEFPGPQGPDAGTGKRSVPHPLLECRCGTPAVGERPSNRV